MTTVNLELTSEEIRLLRTLLRNYWHDLNQQRMLTAPGSPQETSILADQVVVEGLQGNLR